MARIIGEVEQFKSGELYYSPETHPICNTFPTNGLLPIKGLVICYLEKHEPFMVLEVLDDYGFSVRYIKIIQSDKIGWLFLGPDNHFILSWHGGI